MVNAIEKAMNVQHRYKDNTMQNEKYIQLGIEYKERDSFYPIDLAGYEKLGQVIGTNSPASVMEFISINVDNETLTVRDGPTTEVIALGNTIASLRAKYGNTSSSQVNQKDLEFTLIGEKHQVRVFLTNFSYKNLNYKE